MIINYNHPEFNMGFEIICLISVYPDSSPLKHVAFDLGITQSEIRECIRELKNKDIRIQQGYEKGGAYIMIPQKDKNKIRKIATDYYDTVYCNVTND